MLIRLRKKTAQSTLEYAIVIAVIVAALIAMQIFIRRGYMGSLKEGADSMGPQFSPGSIMDINTITNASSRETMVCGITSSKSIGVETTRIDGNYTTPSYKLEWTP
ncbi:MAG: hypothetical protein ABH954_04720 [Candidatus Omnitrophota bacterium]